MKTVSQVGEFDLIRRLESIFSAPEASGVAIGIGDDAAVLTPNPTAQTLTTCDILIEDVHFRLDATAPRTLGRRAISVSMSDIASMGGVPVHALISLALPATLPLESFDEIARGMQEQMSRFGASIVGGNLARAPRQVVIDVFMMGEVEHGRFVTRAGAKPGDSIFVTGTLGGSSAGRDAIETHRSEIPPELSPLVGIHLDPVPRVVAGRAMAQSGLATAMIDVSDGLAADLGHICDASAVGAEIHGPRLPHAAGIERVAGETGVDPLDYVLFGGEDYELLFTVSQEASPTVASLAAGWDCPVREIGRILPQAEGCWLVGASGEREPLDRRGWDHFRGPVEGR